MENNALSCKIELTGELSDPEFQVKTYRCDQLSGPERKATFDRLGDALEWIGRVMPEEAARLLNEINSEEESLPRLPFVMSKGPDGVEHPVYFIQDQSDLKLALKLRERYFKESTQP